MLERGAKLAEDREINARPLTADELSALVGQRNHEDFLNTRNELYRERNMKEHPPGRAEALKLIAENQNLLKRPLLIAGDRVLLGFDEKVWKELLK